MGIFERIFYKSRFSRLAHLGYYLVILVLLISIVRNVSRIANLNKNIQEEEQSLVSLRKKNDELKKKVEEVKSDEFIEKQARDKLGLAKEGETVVVLPDGESLKKLAPLNNDESETLPDPNWKKWEGLFGF